MELGLKITQNQVLAPQMEQSVRILQMDSAQLSEYLKEVMLENPVAELEPPRAPEKKKDLALRKLEWLESQTVREKENVGYYDEEEADSPIEKTVAAPTDRSLADHLLTQIGMARAEPAVAASARFVVGFVDENGYLTADLEEIAQEGNLSAEQAEKGLSLVQNLDPSGVGARDLTECLLLQLGPEDRLARQIAQEFLQEIAKKNYPGLARQLGVPEEEAEQAVRRIRKLNPKPGALYGRHTPPAYITPDVVVTNFGDRYNVMLCEFGYPEIRLSPSYLKMARETDDPEVSSYINNKVSQINWVIKCIENRNKTLLEVSKAIVKRQERFFRYGPQYLNILRMREIAEMVGMHESTVSRAVRDKYLQCAHGVYPLRYFFVKGIEGDGGEGASSHEVKERIRQIIEQEDSQKPLSDQKIADQLSEEGMSISRRTVTKYREELGIPRSGDRK